LTPGGIPGSRDLEQELEDARALGLPENWRVYTYAANGKRVFCSPDGKSHRSTVELKDALGGQLPEGFDKRKRGGLLPEGFDKRKRGRLAKLKAPSAPESAPVSTSTPESTISTGSQNQQPSAIADEADVSNADGEVEALHEGSPGIVGDGFKLVQCCQGTSWAVLPADVLRLDLTIIGAYIEATQNWTCTFRSALRLDFSGDVAFSLYKHGGKLLVRSADKAFANQLENIHTREWLVPRSGREG
jgi:hypothetical protein